MLIRDEDLFDVSLTFIKSKPQSQLNDMNGEKMLQQLLMKRDKAIHAIICRSLRIRGETEPYTIVDYIKKYIFFNIFSIKK
ncbi:hypothetical protein POTOM_000600 [Populus tomentosa]|uniref:Uncharacterized protein n=1 Tax=Populus tomentosa TaxID=118781 RepID=A0A8X8IXH9_POPTO|nr:hypothetical protein POTOM_000600 [Populus tomentosa]